MTEKEKDSVVPGTSPSSIKKDLLMFKDEILKDFRTIQLSLNEKYAKADEYINERINKFDLKIKSFEEKIFELSNLIVTDKSIRGKVEKLCQFEDETRDTIFKRRAIFNEFEKKTKDDISRINNILTDSVIYPGIIGNSCKFSSFHDFMDYVIQELAQLCLFRDKSGLDLGPFKKKIDTALETLKLQINHFCSKDFVNTTISQSEERIQSLLKIYDDRLQDTRVENSHYSLGLIKKTEEITKKMEKLRKYQNQLLDAKNNEEIFNTYNNEIYSIKSRINKINEIIKELLSYHPSSKANAGNEFIRKPSKVVSGVKQYIKGNLKANELSTMKKFTYEKSNSKVYDNNDSPFPNTSPFPSPDSMKYNNNSNHNNHNNNENKKRNSLNANSTNLLFLNNYTNKKDNNSVRDKRKSFVTQKSLNMSNKIDSINRKLSDEANENNKTEKNEKSENNYEFKKKPFLKRKTCNYSNTSNLQSNKFTNDKFKNIRLSFLVNNNHIINENKKECIEENENNLILSKKNSNQVNGNNDSFSKDDINQNININKNNTMSESSKNRSKSSNQSIIKEEDENISDNSSKHLNVYHHSERKKFENKTGKNRNENEKGIYIKEKDEDKREEENKKEIEKEKENHDIVKENESENNDEKITENKKEDKIENDNDNESSSDSIVDEEKKGINGVLNNITKSPLKIEKALKLNGIQYNIKPESFKEETNTMSSDHNITSINNKDKIDPYNSENSNLNLVSIKKRNRSNNLDNNEDASTTPRENNNINKLNSQNFKEQNNSLKNNLNNLNNKVKLQHDNIRKIINNINNAGSKASRDETMNKELESNSSFPKTNQIQFHVSMYPKKDTIKVPLSPNTNRVDKSLINSLIELNINKSPFISKYRSINNLNNSKNINSISIKNENKTFTSFPKIKKDSLEQKIIQKKNFNEKKNMNIIAQTLNEVKYPKQKDTKINSYDKKSKKILLINPDNIPSNVLFIRKKNKSNNKNSSLQSERENKTEKIENLKNQIGLSFKLNSVDDDILKLNKILYEDKKV